MDLVFLLQTLKKWLQLLIMSILNQNSSTLDLSSSKLVDLSDLLVERNSYFSLGQTQLGALYGDTKLFPENCNTNNTSDLNLLVGVLLIAT